MSIGHLIGGFPLKKFILCVGASFLTSLVFAQATATKSTSPIKIMVVDPSDGQVFKEELKDKNLQLQLHPTTEDSIKAQNSPKKSLPWWPTLKEREMILESVPGLKASSEKLKWDDLETDKYLALTSSAKVTTHFLKRKYPGLSEEIINKTSLITRKLAKQ